MVYNEIPSNDLPPVQIWTNVIGAGILEFGFELISKLAIPYKKNHVN